MCKVIKLFLVVTSTLTTIVFATFYKKTFNFTDYFFQTFHFYKYKI